MNARLSQDLRTYATGKSADTDYNLQKTTFFKEIADLLDANELNVAALTNKLKDLSDTEKNNLFYLRRSGKASTGSQAAKWVAVLYERLGVPLSKEVLQAVVNDSLSPAQINHLENSRYQQWQKSPFNKQLRKNLEHELKGRLGVAAKDNQEISLAKVLIKQQADLQDALEKVKEYAPRYLPELVDQLYQEFLLEKNKGSLEAAKQFYYGVKDESHLPELYQTNVALASFYVSQAMPKITLFLKYPPAMQAAIQQQLQQWDMNSALLELEQANLEQANKDFIPEVILPEKASNLINKEKALQAITAYLKLQPDAYKKAFFIKLGHKIQRDGLTPELLQDALKQEKDKDRLFAKWNGPENSRAAKLMADLYTLTTDKTLDDTQKSAMVSGSLPDEAATDFQKDFIKDLKGEIERDPSSAHSTALGREITRVIAQQKAPNQFVERQKSTESQEAEAAYQSLVVNHVIEHMAELPYVFDPQGHILVYFPLTKEGFADIYEKIKGKPCAENKDARIELEKLLGRSINTNIFLNLDVKGFPTLEAEFKRWLADENLPFDDFMTSTDRASVIALQEEMTMHVALSFRAIRKKWHAMFPTDTDFPTDQQLLPDLMTKINELVMPKFRDALVAANSSGRINFEELNKALDKARAELAPDCRKALVDALQEEMVPLDFDYLARHIIPTLTKHDFTSTTATGIDYLRTDARNQTVTRITATEHTAHDKQRGAEHQALRVLMRNRYRVTDEGSVEVKPFSEQITDARVPSIAVKEQRHQVSVQDVADKLAHSHQLLRQQRPGFNQPMIYNLLTSLHSKIYDALIFERKNRQRLSAGRILKGAHIYNARQLKEGELDALIFVQNIPVNQHSNELSYDAYDDATAEAALMSDVALLATLNYHAMRFSPLQRQDIQRAYSYTHSRYLDFLPRAEQGTRYFKDSKEGKGVMAALDGKKAIWQQADVSPAGDSLQALAVQALFKMYTRNDHRNKQFGMLVQALSVFVEPMSQAGCKSANERYQAVAGRVDLLMGMSGRADLSPREEALAGTLRGFVQGEMSCAKLQEDLDTAYNQHNLHGSAAVFSEEDQGASSKVKATKNKSNRGVITEFNTNVAETGFLTRLFQKCSSAMQAHKADLANKFQVLFGEKKEHSNSAGPSF